MEKEYIIFCDESDKKGKLFSNFYGGVIVGASQFERITAKLNEAKSTLGFHGEVKWEKVTDQYLNRYIAFIQTYFEEIRASHLRVRIMFRNNRHSARGLTSGQNEKGYYYLYYQFLKHSFGLEYTPFQSIGTSFRVYLDQLPDSGEKVEQFKGYLLGLQHRKAFRDAGVILSKENIAEVRSHDHVILQGLDIILGAMTFRLNQKHMEKPEGSRTRGKRTIAKEKLYKVIHKEISKIHPGFNIGITTGTKGVADSEWSSPYSHWMFIPNSWNRRE